MSKSNTSRDVIQRGDGTLGDILGIDIRRSMQTAVRAPLSKRQKAVELARYGYRVFPLVPNGKTPALAGVDWRKIASKDPAKVYAMWTDPVLDAEQDWNIGIALDPHFFVVDVDNRDGKQGDSSLALLVAINGDLPKTRTHISAGGGRHLIFRSATPVGNSASKVGKHIDIKSFGGYIVGPGSTISGIAYDVIDHSPIAEAPEWLTTLAGVPRERLQNATTAPLVDLDTEAAIARATQWLATSAPENGTYAVAARIKDFGVSESRCVDLLLDHWPPAEAKGEDHVRFRVENAYRYGQNAIGIASAEAEFEPVEIDQDKPALSKIACPVKTIERIDALQIPRREFIVGDFAIRRNVTGLISPPGVGKTTFLLMNAVAVATGRSDIVDMKVHNRGRVLLWNQEDEVEELMRRLLAVMDAFDVKWSDLEIDGRMAIDIGSGADNKVIFASRDREGLVRRTKAADTFETHLRTNDISLAIFDPLAELHTANENDNGEMNQVGGVFRHMAIKANCAVLLAHHTRKPPAAAATETYAGNMDMGRGAGSLNGVARKVATLYTVDPKAAARFGIPAGESHRYVRFDDAKSNLSLQSGAPQFFRREGVTIGGFGGEEVGVLRPVKLAAGKTTKETRDDENATIREASREMLRGAADHRLTVTDIARGLIDTSAFELMSVDTLVKRMKNTVFAKPHRFKNGDSISLLTSARTGRQGRAAVLVGVFAEG